MQLYFGGIQVDDASSERAMIPVALEGVTSNIIDVSIGRQFERMPLPADVVVGR